MNNETIEPLFKVSEVARVLNFTEHYTYRLIREGEIPGMRIGDSVRVCPKALRAYMDRAVRRIRR